MTAYVPGLGIWYSIMGFLLGESSATSSLETNLDPQLQVSLIRIPRQTISPMLVRFRERLSPLMISSKQIWLPNPVVVESHCYWPRKKIVVLEAALGAYLHHAGSERDMVRQALRLRAEELLDQGHGLLRDRVVGLPDFADAQRRDLKTGGSEESFILRNLTLNI